MGALIFVIPALILASLVALVLGGSMIAAVVFAINRITEKIPTVGKAVTNESFKKRYPIIFWAIFTFLFGAFWGSAIDMITITSQDVSSYRETFNGIVLISTPILAIITLGVFIGISKTEKREHIILPTMLFSTFGMILFGVVWRYSILTVSNLSMTEAVLH